jgi:hypothetical protein
MLVCRQIAQECVQVADDPEVRHTWCAAQPSLQVQSDRARTNLVGHSSFQGHAPDDLHG